MSIEFVAYNQHMKEHGGSIVNIIVDMFKGFPSMRQATSQIRNFTDFR